jgi:hypothetical protein
LVLTETITTILADNKNEPYYFYAIRLLRLLFLDKGFGDFFLQEYGFSIEGNELMKKIYDFGKEDDVDKIFKTEVCF